MNQEPMYYDGKGVENISKRVEEMKKTTNTVIVNPQNVDLSTLPNIPYYPY